MHDGIMETVESWKRKLLRRTQSQATVVIRLAGYQAFRLYLEQTKGIAADADFSKLLDSLREASKQGASDTYRLLDDFVGWLTEQPNPKTKGKLMPRTVSSYLDSTVNFLRYCDVNIDSGQLRAKITLPKPVLIRDEPLKVAELRTLIVGATAMMRALLLTHISSARSRNLAKTRFN